MHTDHLTILDIPISITTRNQIAQELVNKCNATEQIFTATPNAEIILTAQKNPPLKHYLQNCHYNLADSVSLLWASEVQGNNWSLSRALIELIFLPIRKKHWHKFLPERVCGSDIFVDICQLASVSNKSIFLLGGAEGVAMETKKIMTSKFPNLKIVGAISGSPLEKDDKLMQAEINNSQADILFLAYGCPKQELWIARNLKKCPSVKVAMGVGGTFDFITKKIKRAPLFIQNLGLEWLWRLLLQPSRWYRIMQAVIIFPYVFLKNHQ